MELTLEGTPAKKRRLNELESADIQIPSTSTAGQVEKKEGLSKTQHGVAYQIKLLMLFFHRGAEQGYSYELETELTNSGKLDDVVFKYDKQNDRIDDGVRYLQAKHSKNKTKTIQFDDLLKENDKLCGLSKYYLSFLKIVESLKQKGKSTEFIKQITLCTNIKFHENLVKCMVNMTNSKKEDNILHGDVVLNRYKFKTKDDVIEKSVTAVEEANGIVVKTEFPRKNAIVKKLSNVTVMNALANKFVKDLSEGSIPFKSMYQTYHGWLVKHIFELPEEFLEPANEQYYVKFRKTFLEIKDGELKPFRDHLLKAMAAADDQTILDSWRIKKIQTSKNFCFEAKNNDTPKDFNNLAKTLANSLSENKKLAMNQLYASSHGWLLNNIFYIPRHHIKINEDFLNNKLFDKDVTVFRQLVELYLKKNKEGPKTLAEFKGKTIFVTNKFFRKPQSDCTPDNSVSNDLVETFLSKLVFVVTCDEESLGKIVQKELGNKMNLIDDTLIASDLEVEMFKFLKGKQNCVTQKTWDQFFKKQFDTISRYASMGPTEKRKMKIDKYKCEFKKQENQKLEKQEEEKKHTLHKILTADKRLMIIYQKYPLLTEIKIHQAFGYGKRDAYIVDKLKNSIKEPNRGTILKAFSSEKRSHLVIINDDVKISDKKKIFLKDVIEILNKNTKKRFTLITVEKDEEICNLFQKVVGSYEDFKDDDTFLDLTVATQNLLEKRKVIFQGRKTDLGRLIIDDELKRSVKGLILLKLITGSERIIIGNAPVHQSNLDTFEEIEKVYIPRSLFRQIKIKHNIQSDIDQFCITTNNKIESDVDKRDIVLITQNLDAKAFKELCEMYDTNIHWLINYINDELVWQESRGDISQLHKYKYMNTYDEQNAMRDNFYTHQIDAVTDLPEMLVLVAADPGMGKSTLLTHFTSTISQLNQVTWVLRINLKDYETDFSDLSEDNIDKENSMKFLYKVLKFEVHDKTGKKLNIFDFASLKDDLICLDIVESPDINESKKFEIVIFNKLFNESNVVLLLDGFDEIQEPEPVISWVVQIKNMAKIQKIWMTTRPYNIQSILESKLGVFSYQLTSVTEKSKEFVKNFWKIRLTQAQSDCLGNNIETDEKLAVYIEELFKIYISKQSYSTFIGVPLHIRMIAEIYEKGFEEFYYSEDKYLTDQQKQTITKHTLLSLYNAFVHTKFYILHKDIDRSLFKNKRMLRTELEAVIEYHKTASFIGFADRYYLNLLSLYYQQAIAKTIATFEENNIGLVRLVDNEPRFVHNTFAEYFTAGYLVDRLKRDETVQIYETIQNNTLKILNYIETSIKSDVMKFVNYYLIEEIDNDNRVLLYGVLNGDLNVLENKDLEGVHDSYGRTPLHLACTSPDLSNFKYLFDKHPAALNSRDMLFGWTPLHYAIACHTKCDLLNYSEFEYLKETLKRCDVHYDVNQKDKYDQTLLMLSIRKVCRDRCFYELLTSFDEIDYEYENKFHETAFDYYSTNWYFVVNMGSFGNYRPTCSSYTKFCGKNSQLLLGQEFFFEKAELCKGTIGKLLLKTIIDNVDFEHDMIKIFSSRGEEYTKEWIKVCVESDNKLITKLLSSSMFVANLVLEIESKQIDVNFIDKNITALQRAVKFITEPLYWSVLKNARDIVYLLLKAGAFYDVIEQNDWEYLSCPIERLFLSIKNNDLGGTKLLLSNPGPHYNDMDVLVNIRDSKNFMTPLQFAASLEYKDIVTCLLQHGAFYDVSDEKRNIQTAEELTKNQDICDILAKTRNLFSAVKEGNIKNVIEYLHGNEYGIVNFKDRKGKQPIHLAIENENVEIVKHLLNTNGIVLSGRTLTNSNVLHLAVKSGNNEMLEILLDCIDSEELKEIINIKCVYPYNKRSATPLDIAIEQKNNTAIAALKTKNARTYSDILGAIPDWTISEGEDYRRYLPFFDRKKVARGTFSMEGATADNVQSEPKLFKIKFNYKL